MSKICGMCSQYRFDLSTKSKKCIGAVGINRFGLDPSFMMSLLGVSVVFPWLKNPTSVEIFYIECDLMRFSRHGS